MFSKLYGTSKEKSQCARTNDSREIYREILHNFSGASHARITSPGRPFLSQKYGQNKWNSKET
jgi:hypothetical protein